MNREYRGRGFGRGRFQSWKRGKGGGNFSGKWRERGHRPDLSKTTGKHTSGRWGQWLMNFFHLMKEAIRVYHTRRFISCFGLSFISCYSLVSIWTSTSQILTRTSNLDILLMRVSFGKRSTLEKCWLCFYQPSILFFSEQTPQSLLSTKTPQSMQSTLDQLIPYKGWKLYFSEGRVKKVLKSTINHIFLTCLWMLYLVLL